MAMNSVDWVKIAWTTILMHQNLGNEFAEIRGILISYNCSFNQFQTMITSLSFTHNTCIQRICRSCIAWWNGKRSNITDLLIRHTAPFKNCLKGSSVFRDSPCVDERINTTAYQKNLICGVKKGSKANLSSHSRTKKGYVESYKLRRKC